MAVSASTVIDVRNGGSDTICGGGFDPSQTAGMWTDGAATVATSAQPRFTSASYTFLIGDVGAYLFIGAGTNWTKGWYLIADTDSGAALLTATASGYQSFGDAVNTSAGCASVASPTGATWAVDYSQQAAAEFSGTDGTAAGAGSTLSSATIAFLRHMVGNVVRITAGTNATAGHHVITSVAAGVATFNNAVTTGATSDTTVYVGGALASPGYAGAVHIAGNTINLKYHATDYSATSTSSNVTVGRITLGTGAQATPITLRGYDVFPGDETANRPTYKWGVNAASALLVTTGTYCFVDNIIIDGNRANFTSTGGLTFGNACGGRRLKIMNCSVTPIVSAGRLDFVDLEITNCSASTAIGAQNLSVFGGYIHDNITLASFTFSTGIGVFWNVIFDTNSPAPVSSTGVANLRFINCVFYGTLGTAPGVTFTAAPGVCDFINCHFESNSDHGIKLSTASPTVSLINCSFYNNTTAKYTANMLLLSRVVGESIPTATVFVDAANGDFRLNNAAGRALKTAGYPATFPGLTWRNYAGIGASGSNPNASGGGAFQPF